MSTNLSLVDQLGHMTVRIECTLPDGKTSTGTGFFYELDKSGTGSVPVIITNNHVIRDSTKGRFILTLKHPAGGPDIGKSHGFELDNFSKNWRSHPNPDIDLCALPLAPAVLKAQALGMTPFYVCLDKSFIPLKSEIDDMIGLDTVTMVGYPNGLWDQKNNLPIFRKGVLASDIRHDWNGKPEFLIDAACFPGSSGSPVMLLDVGSYQTRKGTFMGSSRVKLLGILYAGPQHTVEGEIKVVVVPTQQKAISVAGIPNNIGVIIKSEELLAFEGLFPH